MTSGRSTVYRCSCKPPYNSHYYGGAPGMPVVLLLTVTHWGSVAKPRVRSYPEPLDEYERFGPVMSEATTLLVWRAIR